MIADEGIVISPRRLLQWLVTPWGVSFAAGSLILVWRSSEAPAWFQAVGSVAAVFAALTVANKQARDTAHAQRVRDEVVFNLVVGIAKRADEATSLLFREFQTLHETDKAAKIEILTEVEEHLSAIRSIDPVELPLPAMVEPFLIIRGTLEKSVVMARLLSEPDVDHLRCATVLQISSQRVHLASTQLSLMTL